MKRREERKSDKMGKMEAVGQTDEPEKVKGNEEVRLVNDDQRMTGMDGITIRRAES